MTSDALLKDQNRTAVAALFLVHGLAFVGIAFGHSLVLNLVAANDMQRLLGNLLSASGTFVLIIVLIKLVVLGQVSGRWRDLLVHWRRFNAKPGCRAFTEIGPNDERVSLASLRSRYGELPSDPKNQNRLWYQMSLEYQYEPGVREAHRNYLAARDLTIVSALIIPFSVLAMWLVTKDAGLSSAYALCLTAAYGLIAISAQNYGRRFVENVLAVATAKNALLSNAQLEVQ